MSRRKTVDGSYLTMQESASGTSQNEDTKGQYIMLGECSVTKQGVTESMYIQEQRLIEQ